MATRGLAVPLGIHAAFNFGQWIIGLKEIAVPLMCIVDKGAHAHIERISYAGYFTGMLLATLCFAYWRKTRTRSLLPPSG